MSWHDRAVGRDKTLSLGLIGMVLLSGSYFPASDANAASAADPIRLHLTFVGSSPVTTITVAGKAVQAVVDISGGDSDGAMTLSKELIDAAKGVSLGTAIGTDASGHEFTRTRYRIPVVTIDGRTFRDVRAVQEVALEGVDGPGVPNEIGKHFLSRFFVVVDYAGSSITLWPPYTKDPPGVGCGRFRIPMERTAEARLAVSTFDITGARVRLLWGANAYSELPEILVEKLGLTTVTHGPGSPKFLETSALTAVSQDLGPLEFVVLPLDLPKDFDGILGRNFFDHHIVCLDYRRREIRIR